MSELATATSNPADGHGDAVPAPESSSLGRFLEALQPGVMGPRLAALAGPGTSTCHVLDAKYEPGVRAILLYDVGGRLLRGDLVSREEMDAGVPGTVSPGVRCHWFPADPEMPTLGRVLSPHELGAALARSGLRGFVEPDGAAPRSRLTLLRYRPGKRATVLVSRGSAEDHIVKAYHDPAKAAAVVRTCATLEADLAPGASLVLAPTRAHLPDLAAVVQGRVSGLPVRLLLAGRRGPLAGARSSLEAAARALAELHEMSSPEARERSVAAELRRFGVRAGRVASVAPRQGAALSGLAERLGATRTCVPVGRVGLVHGDCKPSQFYRHGERILLLDLDHLGRTEQASDVGTFAASMRQLAMRQAGNSPGADRTVALDALRRVFLESYRKVRDLSEIEVRWHEAVALERKALRAFARAPGSPMVAALVNEGHRCLDLVEEEAGSRTVQREDMT